MDCSAHCTRHCLLRLLIATALCGALGYYVAARTVHRQPTGVTSLHQTMRKLWSDHVIWTRDYIIAAVAGAPDKDAAFARLMKNQEDLGNAVGTVYGQEAGNKLTTLLKEHIAIAGDVVAAAVQNDTAKLEEANKKWYQNADDIAVFLSSANPHWPKDDLVHMLGEHLKLTTQEATARIKKDWNADVAVFDKIFDQILGMADQLTNGIVQQFPDKFQ